MFLRTQCDKELFLSLHEKRAMVTSELPVPVKRPGIGVLAQEGQEFESQRNDQLVEVFGDIVRYEKGVKYNDIDLETQLLEITSAPAIILQGKFSISSNKSETLQNIGLSRIDICDVPEIADFIPDVVVVRPPRDSDLIVRPNGSRENVIDATSESRYAIDIFDVKHTKEANPSYCAEISMYALMMANWLHHHPTLRERYYVTTNAYLWTRLKQGDSELDRTASISGVTDTELLEALVQDSEDANLRFYLASVRRFFEDVVRVIRIGDASDQAWRNLEWHVNGACSSCDWLGDTRHLGGEESVRVNSNLDAYCLPAARMQEHLCLVPGITRGAKKVLQNNHLSTASDLASAVGHSALQEHTVLKRDARHLPSRTSAVLAETIDRDPSVSIASLVKAAHLLLYASVNFDPSAGLLTGLSLSGIATTFTTGESSQRFAAVPYIVDEKNLVAEWTALEAFLSQIADCIQRIETLLKRGQSRRQVTVKGQIHFWDSRQFQELCNAIGRHLPRVLNLTERKAKALAWVFAPDDLLAKPDSLEASTVVTVEDIVRRAVFTPTPHVITLFDTAEHYRSSPYSSVERDPYYREYLSDGIPRERIYEIWANTSTVKRGSSIVPRNTLISKFSNTLTRQVQALEAVCSRLRLDYQEQFKARSTRISTSIPTGATRVAFDAKLWIWWDQLDFNMSQLEAHIRLAMDGERLEATYEAIILQNGTSVSDDTYDYDVALGSREAKFKEDSRLTLGKIGRPGMPLERVSALLSLGSPFDNDILQSPLWSVLDANLIDFDRVNGRARVRFNNYREPSFAPYLLRHSRVNLLSDVFLLSPKSPAAFDWSRTSSEILREIGNPRIATPDPNAVAAMGINPPVRRSTTSPVSPAARVLWDAGVLEARQSCSSALANAISAYAEAEDDLNSSQTAAVRHAAERALTVIWGPPGTGKTKTLASLIHGLSHEATQQRTPLKILVTGPTYKAVEEVMHRAVDLLANDVSSSGEIYMAYSVGRTPAASPLHPSSHISYTCIPANPNDVDYQRCCEKLSDDTTVVILGCSIRQARRFPLSINESLVSPLFDVVIIDESSQVPVSQSLSAICGLKEDSRIIIAGDHLQMPPIASLEAPAEGSYLVGSIQTYLLCRPFSRPVEQCVLETNYRSNEHIVAFARSIGYPNTLRPYFPDTAIGLLSQPPMQNMYPTTLPWCDHFDMLVSPENKVVTLLHQDEISSQGNRFEARVVAGIVWMLRQTVSVELEGRGHSNPHRHPEPDEFWNSCIGIVTPHRAQRALVIRELEELFPTEGEFINDAVDTVERFQGGQRHTIIVTFGVADTDVISGEEAFLMQLERTNVAVSRAMAKCIVVMPKSLSAYIPEDKKTLKTAFALKDYIEEFCDVRVDTTISDDIEQREAQIRYHQPR